jgi:hypothetical protein
MAKSIWRRPNGEIVDMSRYDRKVWGGEPASRPEAAIHFNAPVTFEATMTKSDTYNNFGQAGAFGRGAHAQNMSFQQVQSGIDLPQLAEELGRLRKAMRGVTTGARGEDKAIGAVADAEDAAVNGDGPTALRCLKNAGKWPLEIAEKIGVGIAAETIKKMLMP